MNFENTLEYDILTVFWEAGTPLTTSDVWDALDKKGIEVPKPVLVRVLNYLEAAAMLKAESKLAWGKRYRPTMNALKFNFNPMGFLLSGIAAKRNTPRFQLKVPYLRFNCFNWIHFLLVWRR